MSEFCDCSHCVQRLVRAPAGVHFVLHSTGDVTAMYPFNRTKLKGENPEQFATQAAVARAEREAMDYADDRDAVAVRHVDRQVGDLAKRVNDVTNRVAGLEKREPTAAVTGSAYFAPVYDNGQFRSVDEANALVVEYARLHAERDELETRVKRQAQTISDVTLGCLDLRKENAALREERGELQDRIDRQAATIIEMQEAAKRQAKELADIREGREKAVAHGLELAKKNDALRFSLTERDLRLATIRSKAAAVPEDWRISSRSVRDLLETCL